MCSWLASPCGWSSFSLECRSCSWLSPHSRKLRICTAQGAANATDCVSLCADRGHLVRCVPSPCSLLGGSMQFSGSVPLPVSAKDAEPASCYTLHKKGRPSRPATTALADTRKNRHLRPQEGQSSELGVTPHAPSRGSHPSNACCGLASLIWPPRPRQPSPLSPPDIACHTRPATPWPA